MDFFKKKYQRFSKHFLSNLFFFSFLLPTYNSKMTWGHPVQHVQSNPKNSMEFQKILCGWTNNVKKFHGLKFCIPKNVMSPLSQRVHSHTKNAILQLTKMPWNLK